MTLSTNAAFWNNLSPLVAKHQAVTTALRAVKQTRLAFAPTTLETLESLVVPFVGSGLVGILGSALLGLLTKAPPALDAYIADPATTQEAFRNVVLNICVPCGGAGAALGYSFLRTREKTDALKIVDSFKNLRAERQAAIEAFRKQNAPDLSPRQILTLVQKQAAVQESLETLTRLQKERTNDAQYAKPETLVKNVLLTAASLLLGAVPYGKLIGSSGAVWFGIKTSQSLSAVIRAPGLAKRILKAQKEWTAACENRNAAALSMGLMPAMLPASSVTGAHPVITAQSAAPSAPQPTAAAARKREQPRRRVLSAPANRGGLHTMPRAPHKADGPA